MKKRGRPKKDIQWPDQDFTCSDLKLSSSRPLSDGLIHLKIQEALQDNVLVLVGKTRRSNKGRPSYVYRKMK